MMRHQESQEPKEYPRYISGARLEQAIAEIEGALSSLRGLATTSGHAEVEGHYARVSDRDLKHTVVQLDQALAALREVEGHPILSDQALKQTIAEVDGALATLQKIDAAAAHNDAEDDEVEGHFARVSDRDLKQAIASLANTLELLKQLPAPQGPTAAR